MPVGELVHIILDNYAAHKHPKIMRWLERHPRFVFHFTPTAISSPERGVFHSLFGLQVAINRFMEEANANPRPFRWTKDPDSIIAADKRGLRHWG